MLLLRIERSQMRWFGHLIRMPPGRLPLEVFSGHVRLTGDPDGRPRTRWTDYLGHLLWEHLGIPQELECVHGEYDVRNVQLNLLPP